MPCLINPANYSPPSYQPPVQYGSRATVHTYFDSPIRIRHGRFYAKLQWPVSFSLTPIVDVARPDCKSQWRVVIPWSFGILGFHAYGTLEYVKKRKS